MKMTLKAKRIIISVWCFLIAVFLTLNQSVYMISAKITWPDTYTAFEEEDIQKSEDTAIVGPDIISPSAILMEASTGQVIYEKNADEALHPASITKIMTLILIFDALDEGKITLEEEVVVSEHAASMGGSQVFLEVGEVQTVETMIKCISIASANDASVAMAERVAGSEEAFVAKMNEKAQQLGMTNTTFQNCCGLDTDGHMSSARDVALMSRDLITRHPQIHDYSTIWMDTITHVTRKGESEFGLSNTNKLIKQYQWATGLKTGSTGLAKCCLSASASKDGIDLIAVIMAAPDSKNRFADAITLLNYGYSICQIYQDEEMVVPENVKVNKGKKELISCEFENGFSYLFMDSYDKDSIRKELVINELTAPLNRGDVIGQLDYYYMDEKIGTVNLIASEDVAEATFGDQFFKLLKELTWA